eukprot:m.168883 g.168883  ORF g.168883 m.168883 type:complete len:672 (-) comp17796_c3_seq6:99-2114(-)
MRSSLLGGVPGQQSNHQDVGLYRVQASQDDRLSLEVAAGCGSGQEAKIAQVGSLCWLLLHTQATLTTKMRVLVFAVAAVAVLVNSYRVDATSYYFDPAGNDQAAGTSVATAWRSLNKTHGLALVPGDNILLKRGGVWLDETLSIAFLNGGTLGSFGNMTAPRPQLQVSVPASRQAVNCVELLNPHMATITQLHIAGCRHGLDIAFVGKANFSGLLITDNFFRDVRQPFGSYEPAGGNWGAAISIVQEEGAHAYNVTVSHNVATRCDSFMPACSVNGLILDSNTVAQCSGNCYGMGGTNMHLRNSVFLRDTPARLFLYGTTDVIIGTVFGNNSIEGNDFNTRGEYEAGPDGCAVDFETSATGFLIKDNTFYRSWGAGIMVFGHSTTSHNISLTDNRFILAGCVQPRNDHSGIAFMCPNGHRPNGVVKGNTFKTCADGTGGMYDASPNCSSNMAKIDNTVGPDVPVVEQPQISFEPPAPTSVQRVVQVPVIAFCSTPDATLRYTVDGSRPTESSPVLPKAGVKLTWPGPNVAFNVRGFHPQMQPSITQGVIVERSRYQSRTSMAIHSSFDGAEIKGTNLNLKAWVCDLSIPGVPPVELTVRYDFATIATVLADTPRGDLVKAKVCPNPNHGLQTSVPLGSLPTKGKHVVSLEVLGRRLAASPKCICDGVPCDC